MCDVLATASGREVFWQAGALLSALGVIAGLVAATVGALDYRHARERAARLVVIHAALMALAWTLSAVSLFRRVDVTYAAVLPPPSWAIAASATALVVTIAGAWCGGEMVYGRGVGVRER